jgi:hypothetical protein
VSKGIRGREPEAGGVEVTVDPEATMHADLDTLRITVYRMADDFLPEKAKNHRG